MENKDKNKNDKTCIFHEGRLSSLEKEIELLKIMFNSFDEKITNIANKLSQQDIEYTSLTKQITDTNESLREIAESIKDFNKISYMVSSLLDTTKAYKQDLLRLKNDTDDNIQKILLSSEKIKFLEEKVEVINKKLATGIMFSLAQIFGLLYLFFEYFLHKLN